MLFQMQAFSPGDYHLPYYNSNQGTWGCVDLHGTRLALLRHQVVLGQSINQNVIFREAWHSTSDICMQMYQISATTD